MRYPRLTAFVEVEVLRVAFRVDVLARNGSQDSIGGSFIFENYPEAFVHVAAWIWYAPNGSGIPGLLVRLACRFNPSARPSIG